MIDIPEFLKKRGVISMNTEDREVKDKTEAFQEKGVHSEDIEDMLYNLRIFACSYHSSQNRFLDSNIILEMFNKTTYFCVI